jgi:hypothetical protein
MVLRVARAVVVRRRREGFQLQPEEIEAVRAARALVDDAEELAWVPSLLPEPALWTPDDRMFVLALVERSGHERMVALRVASGLEQHGSPELVPICEQLLERAPPDARGSARRALAACRKGEAAR